MLLVLAVCASALTLCDASDAQTPTTANSTKVVFKKPDAKRNPETAKIAALCERVKAEYHSKYRAFASQNTEVPVDPELEKAEREYFNENCDILVDAFDDFVLNGSELAFEEILYSLGEIRFYQANSPAVANLIAGLRMQFALPNCFIEASESFLSAMARREIQEDFTVREYIRGSFARGSGVAKGVLSVDLHPNTERAEMSIVLNTNVNTSTVGTSRGVDVYSDNFGRVLASKRIFVNSDGTFVSQLGSATGSMKTRVNSFNANRLTPFGGAIVRSKIEQELPFAERESSHRANQRIASELEQQTNAQLQELNERIQRMFANGCDPMVRDMSTRSSENRLYFACVLGRSWQLGAPRLPGAKSRAELYMNDLSRQVGLVRARTNECYSQQYASQQYAPRRTTTVSSGYNPYARQSYAAPAPNGPIAGLLSAPFEVMTTIADALNPVGAPSYAPSVPQTVPQTAPLAKTTSSVPTIHGSKRTNTVQMAPVSLPSSSRIDAQTLPMNNVNAVVAGTDSPYDVTLRLHQSGPNNAVTVALAGAVFGPGSDTIDAVLERFPGVDPVDVKAFLGPYEPKEERPLDPEDNYQNITVCFDEVRPFSTKFEAGVISTVLRVASCVVDGKEWGPIEVVFVYNVEKRGNSFAFVRKEVEVLPAGFQEGDSLAARFHTFRRIFIKRLEKTISNEYEVVPVSLDDPKTGLKRGALVPELIDIDSGWIELGFRYAPEYETGTVARR